MTDYNDGKWHGWNGGQCPVHPDTNGEFVFADGTITSKKPAGAWEWNDKHLPIVAFRVTKPYTEPREWWAVGKHMHDTREEAAEFLSKLVKDYPHSGYGSWKIIHVREATE